MESDGYSRDDKRDRIDGKGDIPDIINRFKNRKGENPTDKKSKCYFVPVDEIKANKYDLSISRYKEIEDEQVECDPPKPIIEENEAIETEIITNLDKIKGMLKV